MRLSALRLLLATAVAAVALALPPVAASAAPTTPKEAQSFVESIGVNTHTYYTGTPYYDAFATVKQRLSELGVHHIREGLVTNRPDQYRMLEELNSIGVKSTLILGQPSLGATGFEELLATLRGPVRGDVEAVEGPNEWDTQGGPNWAAELREYQSRLYSAVKSDPSLSGLPVIGPSVVQKRNEQALGDISGSLDFGNVHSYPQGAEPEDNVASYLSRAALNAPGKPVMATETGYHNAMGWTGEQAPVSEAAAAVYMPRLFLDYYGEGVSRTFAYELLDEGTNQSNRDENWGLLRNDLSPKPAFEALRNLISITQDPGPAFSPEAVEYDLGGDTEALHQVLLQKRDGSYYLALWRAKPVWNTATHSPIAVPSTPVQVNFARSVESAEVFEPSSSAAAVGPAAQSGSTLTVPVGAAVTIVRLRLGSAPAGRVRLWVSRRAVPVGGSVSVGGLLPPALQGRPQQLEVQSWQPAARAWRTVGHGRTTASGRFRKAIRIAPRFGRVPRLRLVADAAKPSRPVRLRLTGRARRAAAPTIAFGRRA